MEIIEYILFFVFGVLIGNFATPIFYRLPRNITIYGFNKEFTKPPFCSNCFHPLKYYEFLPIIGWLSTLGTCNYCKAPIPSSYILMEITIGILAMICFYLFKDNFELYIIIFCFCVSSILAIFINFTHQTIFNSITLSIIIEGMIYRTLIDKTILPWLASLSIMSIFSIYLLQGKGFANIQRRILVHSLLPASVWLWDGALLYYLLFISIAYIMKKFLWKEINFYITSLITLIFFVMI